MRLLIFIISALITLLVLFFPVTPGSADPIQCYECHGTSNPPDYRPLDHTGRNAATGGFQGNHRTHMDEAATQKACARCHRGADKYTAAHRDGMISLAPNINTSPLPAFYKNTTSHFPQTTTPNLVTCTNVNCHFERETPSWGSPPFTIPAGCGACHGAPPSGGDTGKAGSHARHDQYYPGVNNCGICHSDHADEPNPFAHATSAARRPITLALKDAKKARFGSFSGDLNPNYLPKSRTRQATVNCSDIYCHSSGTSVATGVIDRNKTPQWGSNGPLACDACHGYPPAYASGSPKANSHPVHVTHSLSDCSICHYATTSTGTSISDTSSHVNKAYDVSAKPPYTLTYSSSRGGGGSCSNISCHNNARWGSGSPGGSGCISCHGHSKGYEYEPGKFSQGKGTWKVHATHTQNDGGNVKGPNVACNACHDTNSFPFFKSGTDGNNDGKFSLAETDVCDACHSPGGGFDGVADAVVGAKPNWKTGIYDSAALKPGKGNWCLTCHDAAPALINGKTAPNKAGDNAGYGWFATGHGRSGSYSRMSWQDSAAAGNPGANRGCMDCHDGAMGHINSGLTAKRLKAGFENDSNNSNCSKCHTTGAMANNGPAFYTTTSAYRASAHKNTKCTDCHEVHGSSGSFTAMTKADKQALCSRCHSNGGHPGVGTKSFSVNGKDYTLQCTSCHNIHVITGRYADAAQNKSPVSRLQDNTRAWGGAPDEKMNAYAGTGTYRTPTGESFSGSQLPDYASFCLDCHGKNSSGSVYFGIDWEADNHGKISSNQPNGYGTCPNWFACGKAFGWDNDDCKSDQATCWPVIPRGAGDQLFSREPYTHTERIAGANFVLSCTDCHQGHGTGTLGRSNVNGGSFTSNWNNMCNNCHYYYSDWHAGMSCGNASCHVSDRMSRTGTATFHAMSHQSGSGGTRSSHQPGLVFNYSFEGDLKDTGGFLLSGKWMDDKAGTFATGRSGQALVLDGGKNVQVGTENANWSTDAGYHGTWVYTEMKYNTTMEAWVNPTDIAKNEYSIFTKHTGYADGGYAFTLTKMDGALRAAFIMQADGNAGAQGGKSGARGAFSSVTVPLNAWTHVAATFDTAGPDRNPADPSVGRIRIYVNGVDATTSASSGNFIQPGAGETSIYAYSENSPWNQSICYDGHWCASEFSIGGFYGWQNSFIGMLDEAKLWNTTKPPSYFAAIDQSAAPYISSVQGMIGSNRLSVTFSKGVYTGSGAAGSLTPSDFVLTDTDNGRTITGVTHTAGDSTVTLILGSALDSTNDVGTDTLASATSAIFDKYGNSANTAAVAITASPACPTGQVTINLNETAGDGYVFDTQGILSGKVNGTGTLTGSAYSGGGDASARYIDFEYNGACLQATTAMTLETRIKPSGLSGVTGNYVRRILARDGGGNYQMTVWRIVGDTTNFPGFSPPAGTASIALWANVADAHGGDAWKPVLTDYSACPIVDNHWYQVKAVWNTGKAGGIPGQTFVPADIYVDDQGTDGSGAGENWAGYNNCTNLSQSYLAPRKKLYTDDQIIPASNSFVIGANVNDHTLNLFNGLIDWITWKDVPDN